MLVTTAYQLRICPNGRAFILRSGDGVEVVSRTEGEFYQWAEAAWCDEGPSLQSRAVDTMDPTRPLDTSRIIRKSAP